MFYISTKKRLPPHVWYPEVLHWREGDSIVSKDSIYVSLLSIVIADDDGFSLRYRYKSITRDGFIILEEEETGKLEKRRFDLFIRVSKNISYNNRHLNSEIQRSKEYMDLIQEFQNAYIELEKADITNSFLTDGTIQK